MSDIRDFLFPAGKCPEFTLLSEIFLHCVLSPVPSAQFRASYREPVSFLQPHHSIDLEG